MIHGEGAEGRRLWGRASAAACTVLLLAFTPPSAGARSAEARSSAADGSVRVQVPGLARITVWPGRAAPRAAAITPRPQAAARPTAGAGSRQNVFVAHGDARTGIRLTSRYGQRRHPISGDLRMHSGLDLAAPLGSPVLATSDGIVTDAGWRGGYGQLVSIDHGNGVETRYGHLREFYVRPGDVVRKGSILGAVGSTGQSTGPHLHYEVRRFGRAIDPLVP